MVRLPRSAPLLVGEEAVQHGEDEVLLGFGEPREPLEPALELRRGPTLAAGCPGRGIEP